MIPSKSDSSQNYQVLKLYTIEDKLWDIPISSLAINFTDGAINNVIFSNDPSLPIGTELQGSGCFPASISAVRISTLHRYVEAFILLALRSKSISLASCAWISELAYVVRLVELDQLGYPAFGLFFEGLLRGVGFKIMISEAQEALGSRIRKDTHEKEVRGLRDTWED
jgi:hypothetical protein